MSGVEKRIYAVVAETVFTDRGAVRQIAGRMAAQAVHAVSRMKMHRMAHVALNEKLHDSFEKLTAALETMADEGTTTIILSCRDSRELEHVSRLLRKARIRFYNFHDTNPPVYGEGSWTTALATVPVTPEDVAECLGYLPLWIPHESAK